MKNLYKPHIQSVHPYEPGKPIKELERELGLKDIVKLASNENALGPSPKALSAMQKALKESHLYPEGSCHYLLEALSKSLKLKTSQLIAGNGSNEIIELLARGFLSEGDEVISSEMSFLVYPILSQVCGASFKSVPMKNYRYDLDKIQNAITDRTRLIFIANPNNPTGTYLTEKEIDKFLEYVPDHLLVCFDEAYVDFVTARDFPKGLAERAVKNDRLIILRTFSKSYGLAGLRVGYGIASEKLVGYLHKIRQPFNVNIIAQAGAATAVSDKAFLRKTRTLVTTGRQYFYQEFKKLGLEYLPSEANFVLFNVRRPAQEVFDQLLKKGMIVRSMKAYGLPTWIRVTVGKRAENVLFIKLLKECLSKGKKTE